MVLDHRAFMEIALEEARAAAAAQEVPVGAVLVDENGRILARARNRTIERCDPTAHAEILALRAAAKLLGNYRLLNTTLYVSVEPCVMCMGALIHARVKRLVYGPADPRWGGAGSICDLAHDPRLNHSVEVVAGVLAETGRALLQAFFRARRA